MTDNGSKWVPIAPSTSSVVVSNQWEGKTWTPIGDSITDINELTQSTNKYHFYVKQKLNMATINAYGFSGFNLAGTPGSNSIVGRIGEAPMADLFTVFGGTNDYSNDKLPGTITSTDTNTVYGALHTICQSLITTKPDAKYALFTPLRRSNMWSASSGVITAGRSTSPNGLSIEIIADIVLEVGAYYSIPVLDLCRRSGIEPSFDAHKTRYMPDGLHPNNVGHQRLADVIAEFIKML